MSTPDETFTELTGRLDYPMLVVTAIAGDRPSGCLVGFATHCSIDPARFLVCLSDKNHTLRVVTDAGADALAVHFLPAGAMELAGLFGSETGDELDKFSRCRWHPGPRGLPILDDCGRWFAGAVVTTLTLGDHVGFVLAPFAASDDGSADTLSFQQAKQLDPGHEA
jgi:flavin reductase (DIM6/NTAB) family NADH-FMN oxidoreductase RutF